jgi:antitoxin MazE6
MVRSPATTSTAAGSLAASGRRESARTGTPELQAIVSASLRALVFWWYYCGMKVAVSIPEDLFDSAESLGKRLGVSRSRLYATALAEFLAKHQGRKTTERLNRVYAQEESRLETPLRRLQARSVDGESW